MVYLGTGWNLQVPSGHLLARLDTTVSGVE